MSLITNSNLDVNCNMYYDENEYSSYEKKIYKLCCLVHSSKGFCRKSLNVKDICSFKNAAKNTNLVHYHAER